MGRQSLSETRTTLGEILSHHQPVLRTLPHTRTCRSATPLSTKAMSEKHSVTHQPADLFLSVGGRARRGLDHGGRLVVCQLLDAALAGHDVTDLRSVRTHLAGYIGITRTGESKIRWIKMSERRKTPQSHLKGKVGVLLFLAHLQAGQVRILELQVVLLLEILRDGALHGLSVLQLQWEPAGKTGSCRQSSEPREGKRH